MRSDLSFWLIPDHRIILVVGDVALARLVIRKGILPRGEVLALQRLRPVIFWTRPREEIHIAVVVMHEVKVELVLLLASQLREESLIARIVAFKSIVRTSVII